MSHPQSAAHYEPPPADVTPSRAGRPRRPWKRSPGGAPSRPGSPAAPGVVSSAALVMVAVFSIFIGMEQVELKMLGVGLAAAILLDATIVRGVLLPAAMTLLGDRCWYLPGRAPTALDTPENRRPAGTL